jgi:hypothetical protein
MTGLMDGTPLTDTTQLHSINYFMLHVPLDQMQEVQVV